MSSSDQPSKPQRLSRGAWMVQKERCALDPDARQAPLDRGTPMKELMPRVLKEFGLAERFWEQSLVDDWAAVVGENVAKQSRPGRIQRGTLVVFVRSSVWLNELVRYAQKDMLERLQAKYGAAKIRTIRLQLDPDGFDDSAYTRGKK